MDLIFISLIRNFHYTETLKMHCASRWSVQNVCSFQTFIPKGLRDRKDDKSSRYCIGLRSRKHFFVKQYRSYETKLTSIFLLIQTSPFRSRESIIEKCSFLGNVLSDYGSLPITSAKKSNFENQQRDERASGLLRAEFYLPGILFTTY